MISRACPAPVPTASVCDGSAGAGGLWLLERVSDTPATLSGPCGDPTDWGSPRCTLASSDTVSAAPVPDDNRSLPSGSLEQAASTAVVNIIDLCSQVGRVKSVS